MTSRAPLIGIAARSLALPGRREVFHGAFASYVECVERAGGSPVIVPPHSDAVIDHLDGVILAGGEDLANPEFWTVGAPEGQVDPDRDAHEIQLVRRAQSRNLPVLAVCRGAQLVNCALGGSIARQLAAGPLHHIAQDGEGVTHIVRFAKDATLASVYPTGSATVVSRHNVRLDGIAADLRATAWADDGTVEGIECASWPFVGIQWHPEWKRGDEDRDLAPFFWLIRQSLQGEQT